LDQWIDKARNCVSLKQYDEAILTCKAVIEEYSQWLYDVEENVSPLYKATFGPKEWADEREKLFLRYSGEKGFSNSVAEFLVAENEIERLLIYVEKHLYMDNLERYYKVFSSDYPEKTLDMF